MKAAARVLEQRGYAGFTTNHVAEIAGVGIASVYEYFRNKESIVAAVIEQIVEELITAIERGLVAARACTPEEALSLWLHAMFEAVDQRRTLVAVIVREVPFVYDVPAMKRFRVQLLELSRRGRF